MEERSITSGIWLALLAATSINAFLGATVALLAWDRAHGRFEAWADFSIFMHIAEVSLPLSAGCLLGLVLGVVFRFASGGILITVWPVEMSSLGAYDPNFEVGFSVPPPTAPVGRLGWGRNWTSQDSVDSSPPLGGRLKCFGAHAT
jgi:hypothetical protein